MTAFQTQSAYGWVLPRSERHLPEYLAGAPEVDGRRMYQPAHIQRSVGRCRSRRVALDVGAHVGLWSYYLARWFQSVHAFEPTDLMAHCFGLNVRASNVTLHRVALGSAPGTVDIDVVPDNTGASHVRSGGAGSIPVRRLDQFGFGEVDFVKIDVEGFERFVIEGGRETFLRCRPVVIVEEKGFSERYGSSARGPAGLLQELGAVVVEQVVKDLILMWPAPTAART